MTDLVEVVNIGLQYLGTRTTITQSQYDNGTKNEAIQAKLIIEKLRRQILRMAPWNSALNTANLVYITSSPGTPENTSAATTLWEKGQPPPPFAYEYQYPANCLRPCWIIPATQTGYAGGVPITTAVTGGAPSSWTPPIIYKVQNDQFYPVTAAAVAAGGTGYAIGDVLTLVSGPNTSPPIGAPAKLRVATVAAGVILTATVIDQINDSETRSGGSYFKVQTNPVAVGSVAGVGGSTSAGTGATFNLTFGAQGSQRVILTNQEFATLAYIADLTDPNVMDDLLLDAWSAALGARLCMALTGDRSLANLAISEANNAVAEARKADGNEGLTINDVTPDFIRIRGVNYTDSYGSRFSQGFDWGPSFAFF